MPYFASWNLTCIWSISRSGWRAADARGPDARATTLLSGRNPRGRQHPQGHTAAGVARADECAAKHEGDIAADALAAGRVSQGLARNSRHRPSAKSMRVDGFASVQGRLSPWKSSRWDSPP